MARYLYELVPLLNQFHGMRDGYFKDGNARGYHDILENIRDIEKEIVEAAINEYSPVEGEA